MTGRIFKQIFVEYWLALLLAVGWCFAQWFMAGVSQLQWQKAVTMMVGQFSAAFFMISFMTGQFFRIRKQIKVDDGLTTVSARIQTVVEQLEAAASDLTGHITGGDSLCYMGVMANNRSWIVIHEGKFRLTDIHARIVDLDKFDALVALGLMQEAEYNLRVGTLLPGTCSSCWEHDLGEGNSRSFNIFFSASNGIFNQQIRFRRVDGIWARAERVVNTRGEIAIEHVDPNYPRNQNGEVDF